MPWVLPAALQLRVSPRLARLASDRGPRNAGHLLEQATKAADALDAVDDRPLRAGDVDGIGIRLLPQRLHSFLVGAVEMEVADQLGQRQLFTHCADDLQ